MILKVKSSGGIEYTIQKMNDYKEKAIEIIQNFPDSASKQSLIDLLNFTIERKK